MRKRFLSLLCVLALCLSLLPVTALAADGGTVYVGGEMLSGSTDSPAYATTDDNGTVTIVDASADKYNIKWDGSTLTLDGAKIKGGTSSESLYATVGIYAFSNSGDVSLNIALKGVNEIFESSDGIWVYSSSYNAGAVTLTIEGEGSLNASGSSSGILVQSNNGNATLTIQNAEVTATSTVGVGVQVRSGAQKSASLTVDGGSLTATGMSEYGAGIRYTFGSSSFGSGKPSLTVSGNATVRANGSAGGITSNSSTGVQYGTGSNSTGGIVWNGSNGTVYGKVELQEDLEIGEGESLTIEDGASLNTGSHEVIVNGGTLTGGERITGTVKYAPTITTESLPDGEAGTAYSQALAATGDATITWSLASGSTLPAGLSLGTDGTISGKPTTADTYTFTVTATNASGSDSKEYTIQIAAKSDTTPPMLTAGTVSRTSDKDATVTFTSDEVGTYFYAVVDSGASEPTKITSGDSYTLTSDTNNITLTDLTAGAKDIYIVAKDASENQSATLKMEIPAYVEPVYSISADATPLEFGSVYTGYTQPTAQTVTITNNGNQPLTLTQPASTSSFEVGNLSKTELAKDETATFTVQPKAGLSVGTYSENITVAGTNIAPLSITATFTVMRYSSGGSSTPSKTPSQQATDKIESAKEGSTVAITLRAGQTTLDKEVFEELAGRDVALEISVPGGIMWTVNGQDIPADANLTDLDLGVSLNTSTIPVSVINTVTGAVDTIQLSLKHDGEFGFAMTLSAPLGKTNAGYWANLYYYNTRTRALEFQTADKIASDGTASFPFSHASDYAIVIDTDSHEPVELPFTDVPEDAWYEDAAGYVYKHGLMAGTSATTFAPDVTTSRAMIATILWRMAGSPVVNYAMNYTDVAQGQWCSEAVRWATSEGVVTGYGNGLFGTNDPITREQLATMLWRYAQTEDYDVSVGEDTNILSYTDAFDVAEYAIPAMQWAVGAGIINGTGDGSTLSPQGQATRAQAAVMLMRFCEEYVVW